MKLIFEDNKQRRVIGGGGERDRLEKTLAAWNWGLSNVPRGQPLDFDRLPGQTKGLINFVLGR